MVQNNMKTLQSDNMMYFWRIVFTYVIAFHHLLGAYSISVGWYIGVDFFAILSGYLLYQHIERYPEENVLTYAKSRFMYFMPVLLFSAVFRYCVQMKLNSFDISFMDLFKGIPEYLCLNAFYINGPLNAVDWYVEALFVAAIFFYIIQKRYKASVFPICFLFSICAYSWIIRNFQGGLQSYFYLDNKTNLGLIGLCNVLRVSAGISIGILLCYCSQYEIFKKKESSVILSSLCLLLVLGMSAKFFNKDSDFVYILLMAVGVLFGFKATCFTKIFSSKLIVTFSKLSLFIYLNHYTFRIIIRRGFDTLNVGVILLYLISVTAFSWLMFVLFEQGKRYLKMKGIMK